MKLGAVGKKIILNMSVIDQAILLIPKYAFLFTLWKVELFETINKRDEDGSKNIFTHV